MVVFFRQAIKRPAEIGAIVPSSKYLANVLVESVDLSQARSIIEFGSGTGVFTERIMNAKNKNATFFSMELNASLARNARRRCPGATIYNDSVLNVKKYMKLHDLEGCDHIVSGLPWGVFSHELQSQIMDYTIEILKPRGTLLTFTYRGTQIMPAARRFRKMLDTSFSEVRTTETVWRNLPPAYFYKCVK